MLVHELINTALPQLQPGDTVATALQLMSDFKLSHLPIVEEDRYLGLLSENDLLNIDNDRTNIENCKDDFAQVSVITGNHFLNAVNVANRFQTNIVPVITENREYLGSISGNELLSVLGNFSGANENGAMVVLEMEASKFSISEISRIVESDGASVLHLNIASRPDSTLLQVTIHLNKQEISVIVAAFERYGYAVYYYSGEEMFASEIDSNYKNLMNFLDI
ncbi:MAG TPA: CBS domain-containing protein [Chitinophagaceae bacterium]|nr:CBS domain-containing protein [Chitinophagaceae bacterium]